MTIESIKRSLSATELTAIRDKAIEHTNKLGFILKVFFTSGCSIKAVKNALTDRQEERLSQLSVICLKTISKYVVDMHVPQTGIFIHADYKDGTLIRIEKENNQDFLVLYDMLKDNSREILHHLDYDVLDKMKDFFENVETKYLSDFQIALDNLFLVSVRHTLDDQSTQKEYLNAMYNSMIQIYGINFWDYAHETAIKRKMVSSADTIRFKNCILV